MAPHQSCLRPRGADRAHAAGGALRLGTQLVGGGQDFGREAGRGRYNAVYLTAAEDGALVISAVAAQTWADLARLGWEWLKGDWHAAPAVDDSRAAQAVLASGRRAMQALFDGEEAVLKSPATVRTRQSELSFVTTVEAG